MKKTVLLIIAAFATNFAMAQSIPNGGFENWTTQSCLNPQYYNSSNLQQNGGSSGIGPVNVVQATDAYHGSFAVKLTTVLSGTDTAAAYFINGNPNSGAGIQGGIPYNQKPTGMRLYYKCNVPVGDTALVLLFFKVGGTIFSQTVQKIAGTQSTYTLLTVPLTLSLTPDSLVFGAISSNKMAGNFKGIPGSMLQIDSVTFTGVSSQPTNMNGDFETWQTYSVTTLNNWSISGSKINNQTTDKFAGTYALELKTSNTNQAGDSTYTSEATTGRSTKTGTAGGYPYSLATDTLFFHYKYAPTNANDSASIMLNFKKAGVSTGGVMKLLKASASYTQVAMGFSVSPTPDSVIVFINSSKKFSPLPISYQGADLKIDNMYFKSQATPVTSFTMPTSGCVGQSVQLTDMSSNIPTTWTWTATNGTLSNVNAQTPTVTYTTNGTYTVTLNTGNASGSGTPVSQTITINGTPTVSITNSASDTICIGGTATLTASGASTYSWSTSAITTSITPSPTVTTTYTVTGTDVNACMNTATHTITIDIPSVKIDGTSAGSATLCAGTVLTATASGANTYTWSPGNSHGTTLTGTLTTSVTFTLAGTDVKGCTNVATFSLHINPKPTLTVTPLITNICTGGTATLTATGAVTYTWMPGGANGTTISPSPTVTTNYTVTGKDANGCKNTSVKTITVNTLPTVTVNSASICIGETATLTASGASTYTWNTTDVSVSISPSPTVTTNYTVTGTDVNSCTNTAITTVSVNPLPSFTFAATSTICDGSMATITASGANTYTWNTTATGATITPSPTVTTNYTVTGTDVNTCTNTASITITVIALPTLTLTASTSTICAGVTTTLTASGATTYSWSNTGATTAAISPSPTVTTNYTVTGTGGGCAGTGTTTVNVNALPIIVVNSATICTAGTATLTASGATTYSWSTTETTTSITPSPTVTTNYNVTGIDVNSCTNTATATVSVNALPTLTITATTTTICIGSTTTLTASGSSTYSWSNTGETTAAISPSPTVTTNYTVTGTDVNSCMITDTLSVIVEGCTTGIEHNSTTSSISLFPNPNNGSFTIRGTSEQADLRIIDELGQVVQTISLKQATNYEVTLSGLDKGVYYLIGGSNTTQVKQRFIVVN